MQLQRGQGEDPKTPRELGVQESGWTESQRSPNHGPFLAGCRTGPREHPHPCWPPLPVRLLIYPCQPCCSAPGRAHKSAPPALSSPWLFVQAAVYLQPVGPAEPGVRSLFQAPQASLGEGPLGCSPHLAVLRSRPCTLGSRLFRPVLSCPLFSLCGINPTLIIRSPICMSFCRELCASSQGKFPGVVVQEDFWQLPSL